MKTQIKFRAWLLQEKKTVPVDSIHWNKGYGGAIQIWVDNPEFDPVKHIIEWLVEEKEAQGEKRPEAFFSYTNHTLPEHLARQPHEFILLRNTGLFDRNRKEIFEGDVLQHDLRHDRIVVWGAKSGSFMLSSITGNLPAFRLNHETASSRVIRGTYYELYGTDTINKNPDKV